MRRLALFYGSGVAFSAERCFWLKATRSVEKSLCHRGFGGSESSVGREEGTGHKGAIYVQHVQDKVSGVLFFAIRWSRRGTFSSRLRDRPACRSAVSVRQVGTSVFESRLVRWHSVRCLLHTKRCQWPLLFLDRCVAFAGSGCADPSGRHFELCLALLLLYVARGFRGTRCRLGVSLDGLLSHVHDYRPLLQPL